MRLSFTVFEMSNKKIGVAFLGTGNVAALHEQAVRAIEDVELVGVAAATPQEAAAQAERWGVKAYTKYDELLADPRVDVIFILTPVEWHFEHASAGLRHGKHVIVEKPVGQNPDEISELRRIAAEQGRQCLPGHNYIYAPELRRGQALIQRGDLGKICGLWIHFTIFHSEEMARNWPGALRQVGSHLYYTLLYLLGQPPLRIFASTSCLHYQKITQEDQFMIQAEMPGGSTASLFCSFACNDETADPWTFHVKALGTNGGFSYSWRNAIFNRALATLPMAIVSYEETFREMDEYLLHRCIRGGAQPLSSLEDAESVAGLIELSEQSAQTGLPVYLKKPEINLLKTND
jgi:predicted dehydrogenase